MLFDEVDVLSRAATDDLAGGIGRQIDGRKIAATSMSRNRFPVAANKSALSLKCR